MRTKSIQDSIKTQHTIGNTTVIEFQPGNSTRYLIHLTDLRELDRAPESINNTKTEDGCYVVCLMTEGHGTCMTVMPGAGYLASGYVREKLKVGLGDSVVIAELIAHLTGRLADDASLESSYK